MELNHDCIRAVLLFLEKALTIHVDNNGHIKFDSVALYEICDELNDRYLMEDVYYSIFNLRQAGYLNVEDVFGDNVSALCLVNFITYNGHEFLESIRDNERWAMVKKGISSIRNYSLSAISALAEGLTAGAISKFVDDGRF